MSEEYRDSFTAFLNSRDPEEAWRLFLAEHSASILQVVRYVEHDSDLVPDCFQFVCERLSADSFRRLKQFRRKGPAAFTTWLRAVVRNLCLDWRRQRFGRHRLFKSISRLSGFDQEVFRYMYERRLSHEEAFQSLRSSFPEVTHGRLAESEQRIERCLTPSQRRLLEERRVRQDRHASSPVDETVARQNVADPAPNPEVQVLLEERAQSLRSAIARLPPREQLMIRLRFEQELTLDQIGRLLELGNAQRVERQLKSVLSKLREALE
jgi:RNA polymerase sigma factor (sigma-70 family)